MKTLFIITAFVVTIIQSTLIKAQSYEPLALCEKIFSKDTLANIKKYSTDEYSGHPNGADVNESFKTKCTLLEQTSNTALVNITVSDSTGKEFDIYFHLKKDTIWKVAAYRALAMSGIIVKVNSDLTAMSQKQIDSVITAPHTKDKDTRIFKSREEYEFMLGNTGLTISPDKYLITYFNKNKQAFEDLKNGLMKRGVMSIYGGSKEMMNIGDYNIQLKKLFIDSAYPDRESSRKNLNFLIGGILDNTVGYLYVDNVKNLPKISPNHFIMIRKLADGWYLYKTT